MKFLPRRVVGMFVAALLVPQAAWACFDTYLFLNKSSLVYPKGQMVVETSGEYTMPAMNVAAEDVLSGAANVYYGVSSRFSAQIGLSSSEKTRSQFSLDEYGLRGVFGIVQGYRNVYNLDIVLEHTSPFDGEENAFELSTPNIFHFNRYTLVIHPATSFGRNVDFGLRGHGGVFYRFSESGIIGIGAEYASAQSGSQFGKRLVNGEGATSLFFGSRIGSAYLQNEFIKGWGIGGNDFGFAVTLKYMLPSFLR
ncbi:MAG: hypothetical protein WC674_04870 [Candidatus Krumholzibacteriia bacterium]